LGRSATWFDFDSPLCSQPAEGAAAVSVAGWWFEVRAIHVGAIRHGSSKGAHRKRRRGVISLERLKDC